MSVINLQIKYNNTKHPSRIFIKLDDPHQEEKIHKNNQENFEKQLQAYLRDITGSVPDYCNKANIAIKHVTNVLVSQSI